MNPRVSPPRHAPSLGPMTGTRRVGALVAIAMLSSAPLFASDHADPIDPFTGERREGGSPAPFFSPPPAAGNPASPFHRTDGIPRAIPVLSPRPPLTPAERSQIRSFAVI